MSTSRAKRKRKRRARSAAAAQAPARPATNGASAKGTGPGGAQGAAAKAAGTQGSHAKGAGERRSGGPRGATKVAGSKGASAEARATSGAKGDAAASRVDVRDGVARPQPIWAPVPLTEIGIAAGVIIFGAGFEGNRPTLLAIAAVVLAVVVGELCLREHFAGFRSHALLLAALAVAGAHTIVALAIADAYRGPLAVVIDVALLGGLAWWLRGRFRAAHERAVAAA